MTRRKLFRASWSIAALLVFSFAAWLFAASMARYGKLIERKNLTTLASTAAASLEGDYVAVLHGDSEDIDTATFNHVRAALRRVARVPNVRFAYLMTERAGKWVFLADAEDPGSKDYSPPGQIYEANTSTFRNVLSTGVAAVDGPSPDAWGVWVSGLAPIFDPRTRKPIAVFGMDIRADQWLATINHYRQVGEAIAGLVFALAVSFLLGLYRKTRHVEALNLEIVGRCDAERSLEFSNAVLTVARDSSLDGILVVSPEARIIFFNHRFRDLFQVPAELSGPGIDEPLRRYFASLMKDPAAFQARVDVRYQHRNQSADDRLELVDGRIIDCHSTPLSHEEHGYLGRIWFFRDVTGQVTIEEAVRRSEEKFRQLVEATSDFIWEVDAEVRYTYVSPSALGMLGYTPEEIVGKRPFDFMSPPEAELYVAEFGPIVTARRPFSQLENMAMRKDGSKVVIETSGVPIVDPNGLFTGYRGIDRDISARKEAEDAVEYRGLLLHAVSVAAKKLLTAPTVESAMPGVLKVIGEAVRADRMLVFESSTSEQGLPVIRLRHAWHSPQASVILDATSAATMAPEFFAPLGEEQARSAVLKDMADGAAKALFMKLGIQANLIVPININGKFWGRLGFDDCTKVRVWNPAEIDILRIVADMIGGAIIRQRYVDDLKDANKIVESSPTVLFRLRGDPALSLIYVSHNVTSYGYDPTTLMASPSSWQTMVHPDDALRVAQLLAQMALEGHQPANNEFRMRANDGTYYWLDCRYTPVRDAAGRLVEIEGLLTDITEKKKAADEIALLATTDGLTGTPRTARPSSTGCARLLPHPSAARRPSQSSTSMSIGSRTSMTRLGIPPATCCSSRSASASRAAFARPISSPGWAATSLLFCKQL